MSKIVLFDYPSLLDERFLQTDLGRLYQSIPFDELAAVIPAPRHAKSGRGCKPWFDVKGGIALEILKHYLNVSDAMLIERINTDWSLQLFCGIRLRPDEMIKDMDLPSSWRSYLGKYLDISKAQYILARHWKPYMNDSHISSEDATCYESRIAFPTPVKLVWQCCNKTYLLYNHLRRQAKLRGSRCNYEKFRLLFLHYQKTKKKTKRAEKKLLKTLLKFLLRLLQLTEELSQQQPVKLSLKQSAEMRTIISVYAQQHDKVYGKADKIQDRIVSLGKPYIRPIVRGKEAKAVEFGAKVNKLQVDGISFIEHFSYDAFNEGIRLKDCISLHKRLFGKCTHHSADKIYATNANRSYCTKQKIVTNFTPKGRQKTAHIEQSKTMRSLLNKQRATRLEGSFGNEKNHYLLQKVNARNAITEKCWIFFGIMTANASIITNRRQALIKAAAA